jgi:hypothetical protein
LNKWLNIEAVLKNKNRRCGLLPKIVLLSKIILMPFMNMKNSILFSKNVNGNTLTITYVENNLAF